LKKARPFYYAISTVNAKLVGWKILGMAHSKGAAEAEALRSPQAEGNNSYAQTYRANLHVVPKSGLSRFGLNPTGWRYEDAMYAYASLSHSGG